MTTTAATARAIRQRADLTYKQNVQHGRHGWLRLTPAYSVRLVDQVLAEFGDGARSVFEPFSGTGTTPLCAAYRGLRAVAIDINPFLIWLGRVKSARYTEAQRAALQLAAKKIGARLRDGKARAAALPPLKNIERWWHPAELEFVTSLRGEVERAADGPIRDLLKVAFCRTMISLSNAAFNHQSMSFKDPGATKQVALPLEDSSARFVDQFLADVRTVADAMTDNPEGTVRLEKVDARGLDGLDIGQGSFDLLITSPPYPNRMSYIREVRPYMYWLGFLKDAKEAGELDWETIGGTWGIATSRLLTWNPTDAFVPAYLPPIVEKIRSGHPKNGQLMAQYVHKYFDDMFLHFQSAARILRPGGSAHYIVGNSTFYGYIVPAEKLYCDQLLKAGFKRAEARAIRKRNSKKELVEFHVIAER
ncbi:DNA methyltransferase [Sorangium sp. So ce861]|uniref:DNA methyltransferase n=1 Tax=Sorangium sp. So ce861 TaxID=3133323 RepID=UPI003F5E13EE